MAKKQKRSEGLTVRRPERAKLTPKESLKRLQEFPKRKEQFIAAIRKGKGRDLSA